MTPPQIQTREGERNDMKEPLSTTQLACRKCGGTDIHTRYHINEHACVYSQRNDLGREGEHLHYHCRNCSYSWTGKTLDSKGAQS